jgi:OOP family OmpA-OmpF porin
MRRNKRLAVLAAAVALGLAGTASAQNTAGSYIGASIGQTDPSDGDLDSDTGFKLFGGYMYTPALGVEVGYLDGGEFDGKGGFSGGSAEMDGAYVAGVGSFAASDRIVIFGKVGFLHWGLDTNSPGGGRGEDDGTELMLGLGVEYLINPGLSVGAEYNQYNDVGDTDVDGLFLNVRYDLDGQ